jgi:hypothetical protein
VSSRQAESLRHGGADVLSEQHWAKADADIKAGRVSKASSDHDEFIAALHEEAARLSARRTKRQAK